ncbi:MAG: hypothetical protein WCO66_01720 [Candidatus Absconditabacteria bacterium]
MISIPYASGFLIENKFLFGNEAADAAYINLATHLGEEMRYTKSDIKLIDYPGEYDIQGITLQCFLGNQNKLNYLINYNGEIFSIIQSPDVLENNTDLATTQTWFYTADNVAEKIDQLELEGEKTKLEAPEDVVTEEATTPETA